MKPEKEIVKLSWPDVEQAVRQLGERIKVDGFKPDYLVGITVGGLVPLALLAKELDINRIVTVSASSYEKDQPGELNILYLPEVDLSDKKVLLIDEIADTGQTLGRIAEIIREKYRPAELKCAVLAVNIGKCMTRPDYSALAADGWIVFPWEYVDFPEYFDHNQSGSKQ